MLIATIEIFYHSISIISHRSHIWAEPKRSAPSYLRQALSTSILSSTTPHELQDQLVLFPFVPYAISLSLSIAYREMRHNKLPVHRMRARAHFQASCRLLEGLEGKYCTAANAANMGKKMLREIDRVFSTVSSEHKTTASHQDVNSNTDNSLSVNHNTSTTGPENRKFSIPRCLFSFRTHSPPPFPPYRSNKSTRIRCTYSQHTNNNTFHCSSLQWANARFRSVTFRSQCYWRY